MAAAIPVVLMAAVAVEEPSSWVGKKDDSTRTDYPGRREMKLALASTFVVELVVRMELGSKANSHKANAHMQHEEKPGEGNRAEVEVGAYLGQPWCRLECWVEVLLGEDVLG